MIFSIQNCKCSHMYLCVECLSGSQCVFKKCQTIWSMEAIHFSCGRLMHLTALVYFLPTLWITIGLICQWNVLNGFYFLLLCLSLEANAFNPFFNFLLLHNSSFGPVKKELVCCFLTLWVGDPFFYVGRIQ